MEKRRGVLPSVAGLVDRAFASAIKASNRRERRAIDGKSTEWKVERLTEIERAYGNPSDDDFFPTPAACDPPLREVRSRVWEGAWPSGFVPWLDDVSDKYLGHVENRTARARFYLATPPRSRTTRSALIAIHGYLGGNWLLEETTWPIDWFRKNGLDVVLPVLPMHAGRGSHRRGGPAFPGGDPRITIEGFRQVVHEVRSIADWLRARGAPRVGVAGMSLGGYASALVATLADIDFVMPMVPLASVADFAREQGRFGSGPDADVMHAATERAHRLVSPLERPLRVPRARALVVAAERDRITPVTHGERIARHFDCAMVTIPGGHLMQLGRGEAFRAFLKMIS